MAAFAKKTFGMYGGADEEVTLECRNGLAGVVIDHFGHDVWMCPHGEDYFRTQSSCIGEPAVLWLAYGNWIRTVFLTFAITPGIVFLFNFEIVKRFDGPEKKLGKTCRIVDAKKCI